MRPRNEPGKTRLFASLAPRAAALLSAPPRDEALLALCTLLKDEVPHYDWVGFYLVDPPGSRELALGPFAGAPTVHVRIPFGRGVCGRAAESQETIVVQDVTREANYLSCGIDVRSEIVLPLMKNGEVLGELDIDSHTPGAFSAADSEFLGSICGQVARLF